MPPVVFQYNFDAAWPTSFGMSARCFTRSQTELVNCSGMQRSVDGRWGRGFFFASPNSPSAQGLILPPELWRKLQQFTHLNLKDVVLQEGKHGAAVVVTQETGPMGMKVNLEMNPAWAEDIIDIITPIDDLSP